MSIILPAIITSISRTSPSSLRVETSKLLNPVRNLFIATNKSALGVSLKYFFLEISLAILKLMYRPNSETLPVRSTKSKTATLLTIKVELSSSLSI
jgi:hypothetical protein